MHHSLAAGKEPALLSPNEERRAAPRQRVVLTAHARPADNGGPDWRGQTRDLSALGVGFLSPRPVEQSTLLEIELCKPNRQTVRTLLARAVHVEPDGPGVWLIGCAFTSELTDAELRLFDARRARPEGPDGRRWVRFPCNVETACSTCEAAPGERRPARIVNVSPGGIGLLLPCDFPAGILLRLQMPTEQDQPARALVVRVVRAMEHGSGYWFHGCEFAHRLDPEDLAALLR